MATAVAHRAPPATNPPNKNTHNHAAPADTIQKSKKVVVRMDSRFDPVIWPEDRPPENATVYAKCEICTPKSRIVWGEGNSAAPAVIILDNPGAREDKDGNAYVCGTRETLQTALHLCGFSPNDLYITYLLKCRPLRRYDKDAVRAFSKEFLIRQISTMQPRFIVCLGDVVVQTMFGDMTARVRNLRGAWHSLLGRPCVVSYHPLAVRRRPNLAPGFIADLGMLADACNTP